MKKLLFVFVTILLSSSLFSQENLPKDQLTPGFHKGRREAFRQLMPSGSIALIFAYPERTFSKDVDHLYHQNPDLYYLTGYKEPDGLLIIFKDKQGKGDTAYNEVLFVRKRDPRMEIWTGRRLGVEGAKSTLGIAKVLEGKDFPSFPLDLKSFTKVIAEPIQNDVRTDKSGYDLYGLMQAAEKKGLKTSDDNGAGEYANYLANNFDFSNLHMAKEYSNKLIKKNNSWEDNKDLLELLNSQDSVSYERTKARILANPSGTHIYNDIVKTLREIKTPEELDLIRKSARISALAHAESMKAIKPEMSERQAEAIHTYVHKYYGAEGEGYPPISGVGANGCILHYEENNSIRLDNQLLLMDIASEYHGYSADVTRTVPGNGKFSPEQKAIYQLVYDAQDAAISLCREGGSFAKVEKKASQILSEGLIRLGIIKNASDVSKYYPHGCSHYIGLDVHDQGHFEGLKANMVITVEPGIYIPANSPCDKKWWNIGVRIEDDVLITKTGHEILSADAPRKWQDVEKKASEKSSFKSISLPKL